MPQDLIDKELDIYKTQARNEGKPDNIVDRIAQGKIDKFYQEACLLEQSYVRDPDKTVKELLTEHVAKLGENIVVKRFVRYQLGEE